MHKLTEFSERSTATDAAISDVEQTNEEHVWYIIHDVLFPPGDSTVLFTRRTEQWNGHCFQRHYFTYVRHSLQVIQEQRRINKVTFIFFRFWT